MKQYLDLMKDVLNNGVLQKNRTGVNTIMIPGAMMKFDMADGFPAVTTKKLAFNSVKGELLGFLRGYTSAADFRKLGCKIWDQNANDPGTPEAPNTWVTNPVRKGEDDLGYIYSKLWNEMPKDDIGHIYDRIQGKEDSSYTPWNQINMLIQGIRKNPESRRLIVSGWHPEVFHLAALPPCHVLFQVLIEQASSKMHITMYQRSCDVFLGVPFNVASYSLLLHLLAKVTGYIPGTFTWFGADVHIYENHVEAVKEQLAREPLPLPKLVISDRIVEGFPIREIEPDDIWLEGYEHHPAIKAPMAV